MKTFARLTWRTFVIFFLVLSTAVVAGGFIFVRGVEAAPVPDNPQSMKTQSAIKIVANDEKTPIATIQPPNGAREVISSRNISPFVKKSLIAAEDSSFEKNPGFAPQRIASAAYGHLKGNEGAGGGSGITQQLVKNTLVGDEVSMERKWKELLSSTKLTATWDKDDIISSYLNVVYFGRGALGVEKAAQAYFGKHASELNLSESALLAGVIQSPSRHDPAVNEKSAHERFDYVKNQLKKNDLISQQEYDSMEFPHTIAPQPLDPSTGLNSETGHIATQALLELAAKGIKKEELFNQGATIVTTIDPRIQKTVVDSSRNAQDSTGLLSAVVSVDNATGAVRGLYGGDDGLGYDRADNDQLTGSTFKIFTLATALNTGAVSLDTPVSSDPYVIGNHTVNNSEGMSCGTCSVAEATKQSLNTSFYRIVDMIPGGANAVSDTAHKLGVTSPLKEADGSVNHSITLGTYGTSMRDMAFATSTILNGGEKKNNHIVDHVSNRNGQVVYRASTKSERVISPKAANDVKSALAPIADYSNNNGIGKPSYSKTGTTEHPSLPGNRDGLMVGGSDTLTTAVWMGMADGSPRSDLWGATHPASLWSTIMRQVG